MLHQTGHGGFAALKEDGSIVTWGNRDAGNKTNPRAFNDIWKNETIQDVLDNGGFTKIISSDTGFAALNSNGSMYSWGKGWAKTHLFLNQYDKLSEGVVDIVNSKSGGFAAIKQDGSVVTWGYMGGFSDPDTLAEKLSENVASVYSNDYAFVAVKNDGSAVVWGNYDEYGADISSVESELASGIVSIVSNSATFSALKDDGSVISWGRSDYGGDQTVPQSGLNDRISVSDQLTSGVTQLFSTENGYLAVKDDNSIVSWGTISSKVSSNLYSDYREFGVS